MAGNRSILGVLEGVDGAAVRVRQDRCAKVRNRNVECLRCAEACTSGCIALVDGRLAVDARKCVGCGTCATVCPTCVLEARNPADAQLEQACLAARQGDEVAIACEQVRRALSGLLVEGRAAGVVCLGRVDESLVCALAVKGVRRVRLVCGECSRCAQKPGLDTARLVAAEANGLLAAWGSDARVLVTRDVPAFALADGVNTDTARRALDAYFAQERGNEPVNPDGPDHAASGSSDAFAVVRVMKDGTLPHFLPNRRERVLDSLAQLGEPQVDALASRLWGSVVIDGARCSSCRMCATFCPTGAIRKFDDEDGAFGVLHAPADCVKCGSCRDICPEGAIILRDEARTAFLTSGAAHRYAMAPRPVQLGNAQQIVNTMRERMKGTNIFER